MKNPCPTGCGRGVETGKLLCSTCWREVPAHLQREVTRTWRAWRRNATADVQGAWQAYTAAREQAIASVP